MIACSAAAGDAALVRAPNETSALMSAVSPNCRQAWHKITCFSCKECNKRLESTTLCEREGEIYCRSKCCSSARCLRRLSDCFIVICFDRLPPCTMHRSPPSSSLLRKTVGTERLRIRIECRRPSAKRGVVRVRSGRDASCSHTSSSSSSKTSRSTESERLCCRNRQINMPCKHTSF